MKIGDKVRFLNSVGGGVISGFQGKDIVLVEDSDGFEIPTLAKEVVVIETDDYNIAKVHTVTPRSKTEEAAPAPTSVRQALNATGDEADAEAPDLADAEITYRPMAQERRGAEQLNVCLAFVPVDIRRVTDTAFEAYLVNDCNYYVHYALLTLEGAAARLRHEGELAPNTKTFLEEFTRDRLAEWERVSLQLTAYKRDKSFLPKPPLSVALRIDGTKFYKLHTFTPNEFFNEPSLMVEAVKDDRPVRSLFVDAADLRDAMLTPQAAPAPRPVAEAPACKAKADRNAPVVVDLHAHELLDTMVGLGAKDILEYQLKVFRETLAAHLGHHGRRLVFIHGKGDGVLRNAILKELRRCYPQLRHQDASFREYGYGATMVIL